MKRLAALAPRRPLGSPVRAVGMKVDAAGRAGALTVRGLERALDGARKLGACFSVARASPIPGFYSALGLWVWKGRKSKQTFSAFLKKNQSPGEADFKDNEAPRAAACAMPTAGQRLISRLGEAPAGSVIFRRVAS